jgi:hypothetical protein
MKTYMGSGRVFFTSALGGGKLSAPCFGHFIFSERAPDTHWVEGWVGPGVGLDAVVKRKYPSPVPPVDRTPAAQSVA